MYHLVLITYKSKESAQVLHEAIRPSHPLSLLADVDRDGQRLYALIKRLPFSLPMPQLYESTSGKCRL